MPFLASSTELTPLVSRQKHSTTRETFSTSLTPTMPPFPSPSPSLSRQPSPHPSRHLLASDMSISDELRHLEIHLVDAFRKSKKVNDL